MIINTTINPMLKIRKHLRSDIPYRIKWLNDPVANRYLGDRSDKRTTRSEQEKWFDAYIRVRNKQFFTICDDDCPIGFMGLSNISSQNRNAELFIMIGEEGYRGKGFGKKSLEWLIGYGFGKLGLHKLSLFVYRQNSIAVSLYQRLGFEIEGVLKDDAFFDGSFHDSYSMALFAEQYRIKAKTADKIISP